MLKRWPLRRLNEVCEVSRGKTITRKQAIEGDIPVVAGGLKSSYSHNTSNRPANVITVSGSGANAGFVNFWPIPIFASDCSTILPLDSKELDVRFVYYAMLNLQKYISMELRRGSAQPHVYAKDIALLEIPFPPLKEQQCIVSILDEAFEKYEDAINNVQKKIYDAKKLDEQLRNLATEGYLCESFEEIEDGSRLISRMKNILQQKIDSGEIKKPRTASIDQTTPPFEVPPSWEWVRLQEVTSGITDGVHKKPNYVSEGIPFITVRDMTSGPGISFKNTKFIEEEEHKEFIKRTNPEKGDILISKDGTIGVVRLIETDIEFSIFVSVALVKPILKETGKFIALALSSQTIQKQIIPKGAALKHLYVGDLRRLWIPIPPLSEMQLIVEKFEQAIFNIEILTQNYCLEIELLENLKQSILEEAFNGKLTGGIVA